MLQSWLTVLEYRLLKLKRLAGINYMLFVFLVNLLRKVTVHVREVNNHPPVFSHQFYEGSVLEKLASDRVVIRLHATDLDLQNNTISYDITSGNEDQVFTIDHTTGEIRANPANVHLLDYDRKQQYIMLVQAKDCK